MSPVLEPSNSHSGNVPDSLTGSCRTRVRDLTPLKPEPCEVGPEAICEPYRRARGVERNR